MKKTIYRLFSYAQCDKLARYLSNMAAEGWHFREWKAGLVFEKGEAKQIEYAVEVFQSKNINGEKPKTNLKELTEYCEAAGWKFITAKDDFHIFQKISETAVPIVEKEERIKNIGKKIVMEKLVLWLYSVLICLCMGSDPIRNPEFMFFQGTLIFLPLILFLGFFVHSFCFVGAFLWRKSKQFLVSDSVQLVIYLIWEVILLVLLLVNHQVKAAGIAFILFLLTYLIYISYKVADRRVQRILHACMLTFIVFGDMNLELPAPTKNMELMLVQEDYKEIEGEFTEGFYMETRGVLGSMRRGSSIYRGEKYEELYRDDLGLDAYLTYTIYQSEHDWVLDLIWKKASEKLPEASSDDTKKWEAIKAISGEVQLDYEPLLHFEQDTTVTKSERNKIYLIRYEDKVIEIWEPDALVQNQIDIIREKLE